APLMLPVKVCAVASDASAVRENRHAARREAVAFMVHPHLGSCIRPRRSEVKYILGQAAVSFDSNALEGNPTLTLGVIWSREHSCAVTQRRSHDLITP